MITEWVYKNKLLYDEEIPKKSIGFIYLMTHVPSGKKYIGRKLLTQSHQTQKNKKITKTRKESDWKKYYSSCPEILQMIREGEPRENFKREILQFISSKGMLVYAEELVLYMLGALETDDFFNSNIRSKVYRNWVRPNEAIELRQTLTGIL